MFTEWIHLNVSSKRIIVLAALLTGLTAFSPQIKIHAPAKLIVINLNVEIEQEVRIKVENDIDDLFHYNKGLF
ncbi:MAG: YnbE family lipoprotein [Alphaproteobacteria bacterium]